MINMPRWLQDHLIGQGKITPSGLSRRAVVRPCRSCGAWTMQGLDADVMAGEAITDVYPLDALCEAAARMGGLKTFNLTYRGDRYELDWRDPHELAGNPPGARPGCDVVCEHRCGVRFRPDMRTRIRHKQNRKSEAFQEPPF